MIQISHITNYYPIKNDKNQKSKVPRLHKENEIRNKLGKLFYFSKAIKEGNSLSTELKNIKYENKFKEKLKQELIVVKKKEDSKFERIV